MIDKDYLSIAKQNIALIEKYEEYDLTFPEIKKFLLTLPKGVRKHYKNHNTPIQIGRNIYEIKVEYEHERFITGNKIFTITKSHLNGVETLSFRDMSPFYSTYRGHYPIISYSKNENKKTYNSDIYLNGEPDKNIILLKKVNYKNNELCGIYKIPVTMEKIKSTIKETEELNI